MPGWDCHTPADVHYGTAEAVRDKRAGVLAAVYAAHPERLVRKPPEPPTLPADAWINKPGQTEEAAQQIGLDGASFRLTGSDLEPVHLHAAGASWAGVAATRDGLFCRRSAPDGSTHKLSAGSCRDGQDGHDRIAFQQPDRARLPWQAEALLVGKLLMVEGVV
jgi:hypothetical protein